VEAVAVAVGLQPGDDPIGEVLAHFEPLTGLLVLDNCEHLLDASAELTGRLLPAAPDIRVLATSREPLGLAGERLWPVRPLDVPDESLRDRERVGLVESADLLLDRARAVRPDLEVGDDDVASVVHICRALDGVPLAIELAAGRLRSLTLADLATRLGDQLAVLARHRTAGRDDARHQTLRATLDWSYDLLTKRQQLLARRLSVFAGGFRLDGAEAVCGGDLDVLDGIDELVAKSLVTFDGRTARYRLLEPLRQYLAERLDESGSADVTRLAHAKWIARLSQRLGRRLMHYDQQSRSQRLREESGNIDVALRWSLDHGDTEDAVRIVGSLGEYWLMNDQASGRRWCAAVVETGSGAAPRRRAKALLSAGIVAQSEAAWARSIAWLGDALAIYEAEEHTAGQAACLFWLGRAHAMRWDPHGLEGDAAIANECFEAGLRMSLQLGDHQGAGWFRIWLSSQAFRDEDLDRAAQLTRQVLDECGAAGARHPVGQASCNLAFLAFRRGHHDAAVGYLQEAVALYRGIGDDWELAATLVELAAQTAVAGQGDEALGTLAEATRLDQQIGRLPGRSYSLAIAAAAHLARGQTASSISALGAWDAHPITGTSRPWVELARSINWLADVVDMTRARLDPAEVRAATGVASAKTLDQLIDELILRPAADALDDRTPADPR
jgi:predicted ATPase